MDNLNWLLSAFGKRIADTIIVFRWMVYWISVSRTNAGYTEMSGTKTRPSYRRLFGAMHSRLCGVTYLTRGYRFFDSYVNRPGALTGIVQRVPPAVM